MTALLQATLSNILIATIIAALALLLSPRCRNPHIKHFMWFLAAAKLVTPPILSFELPGGPLPSYIEPDSTSAVTHTAITEPQRVLKESGLKHSAESTSLPEASQSLAASSRHEFTSEQQVNTATEPWLPVNRSESVASQPVVSLPSIIFGIWLIGVVAFTVTGLLRHRRFLRLVSPTTRNKRLSALAADIACRLKLSRVPDIAVSQSRIVPVAFGFMRPGVILPQWMLDDLSNTQLEAVITHEFGHIRHKDHLCRWLQFVVLAAHWWNPIAWLSIRNLRRAEEECCDRLVVQTRPESRRDYGLTLLSLFELNTERLQGSQLAAGLGEPPLLTRIRAIMSDDHVPKWNLRRRAACWTIGVACLSVGLALGNARQVMAVPLVNQELEKTEFDQSASLEANLRLRRFARVFEQNRDPEDQRLVRTHLADATPSLAPLRQGRTSAAPLDKAVLALSGNGEEKELRYALSQSLIPKTHVIATDEQTLEFRIRPVCKTPAAMIEFRLRMLTTDGTVLATTNRARLKALQESELNLNASPEGDHRLVCEFSTEGKLLTSIEHMVSVIKNPAKRLGALQAALIRFRKRNPYSYLTRTTEARVKLLERAVSGESFDSPIPARQLLSELEAWVAADRVELSVATQQIPLTYQKRKLNVRLAVPQSALAGTERPILIAYHAGGGDEHSFSETCAAGRTADLCRQREWTLVCPRMNFLGATLSVEEMLASLRKLGVAVDKDNVFLMGHGQGAVHAAEQLQCDGKVAGLAIIGGGIVTWVSEANLETRLFIARGRSERDAAIDDLAFRWSAIKAGDARRAFTARRRLGTAAAMADAASLWSAMNTADAPGLHRRTQRFQLRKYVESEMLGLPQVALDDTFKFFDEVRRERENIN